MVEEKEQKSQLLGQDQKVNPQDVEEEDNLLDFSTSLVRDRSSSMVGHRNLLEPKHTVIDNMDLNLDARRQKHLEALFPEEDLLDECDKRSMHEKTDYINLAAAEKASQMDDLISMSSTSTFKKHGFESLAKNEDDEAELDKFFSAQRQFMILTNAGKPVFSLNGDIYSLSPIFATLYAIISKCETFRFADG